MQIIKEVYPLVNDLKEKEIFKGCFLKYAENTEDSISIAFFNEIYHPIQFQLNKAAENIEK